MSVSYTSILWNKNKKKYDLAILLGSALFIAVFTLLNLTLNPLVTFETNLIRSFGWLAILLLHVILTIGPLARINPAFNIVLYNRSHLGVLMFIMGLIHGGFSTLQFHSLGNLNPIQSIVRLMHQMISSRYVRLRISRMIEQKSLPSAMSAWRSLSMMENFLLFTMSASIRVDHWEKGRSSMDASLVRGMDINIDQKMVNHHLHLKKRLLPMN